MPVAVVIDAETTSWELTLICCQELISETLLMNVTVWDFLGCYSGSEVARDTISGWPKCCLGSLCKVLEV